MRRSVIVAAVAAVAVIAVGGVAVWRNWPVKPPPVIGGGGDNGDGARLIADQGLDAVLAQLAQRTSDKLGGGDDLQVVVTEVSVPVGALLEKGRGVPEDDTSCGVEPEPKEYAIPNLLASIDVSARTAGQLGFDEPLAKVGATVSSASRMALSFKETGLLALTGAQIRDLLKRETCVRALAGRDLLMVRGYVIGRRNLTLTDTRGNKLEADARVGGFRLEPSGDSSIAIVDDGRQRFLQLVSEVKVPAPSSTAPGAPAPPPVIEKPSAPPATQVGLIFVQQDEADAPDAGVGVVGRLKQNGYKVAARVEHIPSRKMPNAAQVRYFNATDQAKAQAVAELLAGARTYKVVRTPLPAPPGQLEIWLSKVGS